MSSTPVVALVRDSGAMYPQTPPFDPSEVYPELAQHPLGMLPRSKEPNPVYGLVRSALAELGLDRRHLGTAKWNPLRGLVPRSGLVVIKPNLVLESRESGDRRFAVVTHGSVVRALIDYVRLAGGPDVDILVGDVPLQGTDFDLVVRQNGLRQTVDALRARGDGHLELRDLRRERAIVDEAGFISRIDRLEGDPRGYVAVDVGEASQLEGLPAATFDGFAVSDYRQSDTQSAHEAGRHEYLVPSSILAADLFVNVPKLKTHQKAGLTVAIKNLVGVNGDKSRIPHFRLGTGAGGDEFPPDRAWLRSLVSRVARQLQGRSRVVYRSARWVWRSTRRRLVRSAPEVRGSGAATLVGGGAWHGNDTLWRALHDLNLILAFTNVRGVLQPTPQRKYVCVVDGIVAGEGDGPLFPLARREGAVLAGDDPLAVDLVAARYMGLDWTRIPQLSQALSTRPRWTRVASSIEDGGVELRGTEIESAWWAARPFLPPPGWVGHVELVARESVEAFSGVAAQQDG